MIKLQAKEKKNKQNGIEAEKQQKAKNEETLQDMRYSVASKYLHGKLTKKCNLLRFLSIFLSLSDKGITDTTAIEENLNLKIQNAIKTSKKVFYGHFCNRFDCIMAKLC